MSPVPFDIEKIRDNARAHADRAAARRFPHDVECRKELAKNLAERIIDATLRQRERDRVVLAHPAAGRHPDLVRLLTDGTRLPAETVIARLEAYDVAGRGAA